MAVVLSCRIALCITIDQYLSACLHNYCKNKSSSCCQSGNLNLSKTPFLPLPAPQDESSALAQTALAAYQFELKRMSLRAVNFLLVNPGKKVMPSSHIAIHYSQVCLLFLGEKGTLCYMDVRVKSKISSLIT